MLNGMMAYPPQAIQCKLIFPDAYAEHDILTGKSKWPSEARLSFIELADNRFLSVHFVNRTVETLQADSSVRISQQTK